MSEIITLYLQDLAERYNGNNDLFDAIQSSLPFENYIISGNSSLVYLSTTNIYHDEDEQIAPHYSWVGFNQLKINEQLVIDVAGDQVLIIENFGNEAVELNGRIKLSEHSKSLGANLDLYIFSKQLFNIDNLELDQGINIKLISASFYDYFEDPKNYNFDKKTFRCYKL